MELAGGTDVDLTAAVQRDGGGVVAGGDAGVGEQSGAAVLDFEAAGDDGVFGGDRAHGLLGVRDKGKSKDERDVRNVFAMGAMGSHAIASGSWR